MKKEKDVLFLCQYFYPEYVSSATLPYDTSIALAEADFSVEALCGYPKEYNLKNAVPLHETHENIEIKRLKYLQLLKKNFFCRLINYFSFTFVTALHFGEFKKYKSIIVYSNPPVLPLIAALSNKFFGTKVVFVSYDVYPELAYIANGITENGLFDNMMKMINKFVFKHVNTVVALSNEMKTYLLEHRSSLTEQQIKIIPNWYENKDLPDETDSLNNNLFKSIDKNGVFIVSYFGNLGLCQDLDTIIEAIRELKEDDTIQFVFAVHGCKVNALQQIIEKEGLKNVRTFGFLHGKDFHDALCISDCFMLSLTEGLTGLGVPSKTYSYMMSGKPVIAIMGRDSDIARDLLDNNAGYSMEVGESDKLVSAIIELRDNEDKRRQMGMNCRRIFLENYTREHCTKRYVDMIKQMLEVQGNV